MSGRGGVSGLIMRLCGILQAWSLAFDEEMRLYLPIIPCNTENVQFRHPGLVFVTCFILFCRFQKAGLQDFVTPHYIRLQGSAI